MSARARGRGWRRAAAAAAAVVALLTGCGEGGGESPAGTGAGTPPPATGQAPPAHRWQPPAVPRELGSGRVIGAVVRARYAETSFSTLPTGFVPGGVPVGSFARGCRVPDVTAEDRAGLQAAAGRQTPHGTVGPIEDQDVLLADCGPDGRWALVTWTHTHDGDATDWIDELRRLPDGSWDGTARGVHPGCRMPPEAAAVWDIDVTPCPPRARPAPRTTPPTPTTPQRPPGGDRRLPPGASSA